MPTIHNPSFPGYLPFKMVSLSFKDVVGQESTLEISPAGVVVSATGAIETAVDEVLAANPDKVEEIKAGNEKLVNFLTGQVMKASKGKANPKIVNEVLREMLEG